MPHLCFPFLRSLPLGSPGPGHPCPSVARAAPAAPSCSSAGREPLEGCRPKEPPGLWPRCPRAAVARLQALPPTAWQNAEQHALVETTPRQFEQLTSSTSSTSTVSPGKRCCNGHAQQQQGSDRHQLVGTRARARAHRCHARAVCRNSPPRPQATLANSPDKTRWALRSNAAACAAPGHAKAYGGLSGVQCISD